MWQGVRTTQSKLGDRIGASVRSAQSASSLQLALENEKLLETQQAYIAALKSAGESGDDIVGFVFAVNGTAQQRRRLSVERAVPQDVDEAPDRERHRGDRP